MRPGRAAAAGHTGPVTGSLYLRRRRLRRQEVLCNLERVSLNSDQYKAMLNFVISCPCYFQL